MAVVATGETKARGWSWRDLLFIVVAGLAALLYGSSVRMLAALWLPLNPGGSANPELDRWHVALMGAVTGLLGGGSMLALLWRPRSKPLLVQYWAVAAALGVLLNAPFVGPFIVIIAVPIALVVASYPAPRALLDFSRPAPVSRPLFAVSLLAAVLLAPAIWHALARQLQDAGGDASWIGDVEHTLLLLLAGLAASTKRPGWRVLGILTGITALYLGVAALRLPHHPGSWGMLGGILALLGGMVFLVATLVEGRQEVPVAPAATS